MRDHNYIDENGNRMPVSQMRTSDIQDILAQGGVRIDDSDGGTHGCCRMRAGAAADRTADTGAQTVTKYIVEARSTFGEPSLFALDHESMVEIDKKRAMRFTEARAREIAAREKKLRPGRKVLIIKVEG